METRTFARNLYRGNHFRDLRDKKRQEVLEIQPSCCRTKVHVKVEGSTRCYDAMEEIVVYV